LIGSNQIHLLNNFFKQSNFDRYVAYLKSTSLSDASLKRKLSSLTSFQNFLIKKKLIDPPQFLTLPPHSVVKSKFSLTKFISSIRQRVALPKSFVTYLIISSLLIIAAGTGYTLYRQAITKARLNLAYTTAGSPVYGNRFLSFQGRLTDSSGNPISSPTTIGMVFELFNTPNLGEGTTLYTSATGNSQVVSPDDNGIFSVTIGKSHGTTIPDSVFTQNSSVYLQITAGGEVMDPRQPIATVGYAINSESLQGLPPSASGLKDTVLVIDSNGDLNLGETSPTIKSTSGTLGIEGQAILIKATNGLDTSNIKIDPVNSNGAIQFNTVGDGSSNAIVATNSNLSTGNLFFGQIGNDNRGYNFIDFQNFNVGTSTYASRFSVSASGNVNVGGTLNTANISIGNTFLTATAANLNLLTGLTPSSGSIIYSTSTNLATSSVGSSGQLLVSNGTAPPTWIDSSSIGQIYTASTGITLVGSDIRLNLGSSNVWLAKQTFASDIGISNQLYVGTGFTGAPGQVLTSTGIGLSWTTPSGTTYTATNGLNLNGAAFGLGGLLTQNTSIGLSSFSLSFEGLGGTQSLFLASNGYVGIGTTNPTAPLEIGGVAGEIVTSSGDLTLSAGSSNVSFNNNNLININQLFASGGIGVTGDSYFTDDITAQSGNFYDNVNLYFQNQTNYSDGLRVYKRGNVSDINGNVLNGGEIGYHSFYGWNGSAYQRSAYVLTKASEDWSGSANGTEYYIYTSSTGTTTPAKRFAINRNGNIAITGTLGIGVTNTSSSLEVNKNGGGDIMFVNNNVTTTAGDLLGEIKFRTDDDSTSGNLVKAYIKAVAETTFTSSNHRAMLNFGTGLGTSAATTQMTLSSDGYLGLGTTAPTQRLDIAGSMKLSGQMYVGTGFTGAPGQVLTSNGVGLSWTTPTGTTYTASNGLTLNGTAFGLGGTLTQNTNIGISSFSLSFQGLGGTQSLYLASSGFVGIGTTNPTLAKLQFGYSSGSGNSITIKPDNNDISTKTYTLLSGTWVENDVDFYSASSKELYIGFSSPFSGVYFDLGTTATYNQYKASFYLEYYDGSGWNYHLPFFDESNGFTNDGKIYFKQPKDWTTNTLTPDSTPRYWLKISCGDGCSQFINRPTLNSLPSALKIIQGNAFEVYSTSLETEPSLAIDKNGNITIGGSGPAPIDDTISRLYIKNSSNDEYSSNVGIYQDIITYGRYTESTGILNRFVLSNDNNEQYITGFSNYSDTTNTNTNSYQTGLYNDLSGNALHGVVNNLNSLNDSSTFSYVYGLENYIYTFGEDTGYGIYNQSTANHTSTQFGLYNVMSGASTEKWGIYSTGEDKNYFSGNLGLGTTAPTQRLDIAGSMKLSGQMYVDTGFTGAPGQVLTSTGVGLSWTTPTGTTYTATNGLNLNGSAFGLGGTLTQNTNIGISSFSLSFQGLGDTQSLYLASSGFVGIGITAPQALLHVGSSSSRTPLWIAGGQGGYALASSQDGITWSGINTSALDVVIGVAWNGTRWVAVGLGSSDTIAYSDDGLNWTGVGGTLFTTGYNVAWNGTRWVAVGGDYSGNSPNTIAYSNDGITWTGIGTSIFSQFGVSVAWNGTRFVAVGAGSSNSIAYSSDGINWTGVGTSIFDAIGAGVAWNGTRFVAVGAGSSNSIAYSSDGINWTGIGTSIFDQMGIGVAWNGTRFVAMGSGDTNTIAYSSDGISWTGIGNSIFTASGWGVAWNGTRFVATGDGLNGSLAYSSDGINWNMSPSTGLFTMQGMGVASAPAPQLIPAQLGVPINISAIFDSNVSIGTTANNYKLNIDGDINITGNYRVNGTPFANFWTASGNNIYNNNLGNVGIGNTDPQYKLDIEVGEDDIHIGGNGTNGTGIFFTNRDTTTQQWYMAVNGTSTSRGTAKSFFIQNRDTYETNFLIDPSGNVGIGVETPSKRLDVGGDIKLTGQLYVGTGFTGAPGQVLVSTGVGLSWGTVASSSSSSNLPFSTFYGFDSYVNSLGGFGTGGVQRITKTGNLVNIGTIQANQLNIASGGTFSAGITYPAFANTRSPYALTLNDFNGDNKPDVAIINNHGGGDNDSITVKFNNGDGTFDVGTTYSITGNYSVSITSADFDQDGKIDLAVASGNTSNVLIFFNNGDGTFASGVSYPNPSNIDNNEIVAADANHDGKIDIIGSNFYGGVNTYTNLGGTFDAGVTSPYPYGGGYIWKSAISVNDFNNDGYPDAAVSIGDSSVIVIYPNDKNGNFGAGTSFPSPTTSIYDITSGDFNGDNKADIATVTVGTWRMVVHLNNGDGTFSTGTTYPCSYYPYAVKTADVNSDGKLDIITANNNINTISVFLNNGDGTFSSTPTSYSNMATEPVDLDTADLDGNGIVDIVTSSRNYPNPVITVFKNNSTPILFTSASGSIGIGTTNPLYKLEVVGAAHIMSGFATISESFTGATFPPNGFTTGIGTSGFARDTSTYYSSPASTTANSSGGTLPDGAITWLETGVTMPSTGYLNFQWKVSSESSCDYLVICIDRVTCDRNNYDDRIAGSVGWTTKSLPLSSGNHTIRWAYSKDGSVSSGSDTGWVDNISFESGVEASLFVDDSIGIGTTSPLGKLHVANGNAIFEGYVGIGTTNPTQLLTLNGSAGGAAGIYLNSAVPSSTSYTLYNNAGTLMWNGLALATGGGSISGTTNYIPKYTSASTLGNSIMTDTGYINIAGLAVIGNVSGNNYNENLRLPESSTGWSSIAIGATAGTSGTGVGQWNIVRAPSSWNYLFSVRYNSTDVFAINTSENVGIGTTNPYKKLDINGAGSASVWDGQLTVRDSQTFGLGTGGGIEFGGQFGTNLYNPDLAFIKSYKENATDGNYSFSLVFGTRANGANPAEVMRLTSAGKVGIGTTAPLAKLEVKASGYDVLKLTNPNSGGSSWMFGIWDSGLGGPTNTLSIGYSGANGGGVGGGSTYNLMNLDTSGFVGIAGSLKMTGQLYVGTGFTGAPGQVLVSTGVGLSWASASGSSTTTTNGLSLISSAVGLGGTLTQNTNIGTSSFGLTFSTPSGAIALHIGNSGAVGIGTTNPFAPFHIERNWSGTDLVGTLINNTGTGTGTAGSINFGLSGALTGKIQNIIDPSGTTTSLAFSNFYGGALKETMRLYNGFVGIGTSSPITPLDVGITSSATVSSVTIPDLSANLIGSITATSFYDSNNPKYYVNPASIGENSNSLSLTEGGSIKFNVASAGTTSVYIAAASAARIQNLNNGLALGTGDSNSIGIGNTITWNNQLFLNYNGNIGLGTTNPNKLLEVYNNTLNTGNPTIRISADANSNYTDATGKLGALEFYNNYSTNLGLAAAIQAGRGEGVVASGELHFLTSASSGTLADRMTIDKDGHVGIGTTRPIYPLHVVSADAVVFTNTTTGNWAQNLTLFTPNLPTGSASASFSFGLSDTAYNRAYVGFKNVGTGSTLNFMTFGFHSSDYLLNIKADGNVGINNTNPTTRLDIVGTSNSGVRLKQGGQINPGSLSTTFYSGLTFENDSTTNSYSMGYSTNGYFGLNYFNGTSTYSNLLTLTNTGNFGIGTTVPKALFQVGTEVGGTGPVFTVNSNGRVGIGITSALTRPFQIQEFGYSIFMGGTGLSLGANIFTDTTFNIGTTTNSSLAFYTNNTKRASFDGNGKFTIDTGRLNFGTTATTSSIPTMTAGDMMIGTSNTVNLATSGRIWIRVGTTRYTFRSSSITAGDYSEYFHQSTPSEEGDLMVISSEQSPISDTGQVEKSSRANQTKLIGVVSNAIRGTSYNDPEENRGFNPEFANVGLLGHVYTKVCTENGNILPGDRLTSSSIPGVAMRATQASEIVGYATESYSESDPTKIKKIMVYVSPQYFDPALESDSITNNQFNINYQIPESALSYLGYLGTKNQIENAIYTLKNNANQVVTKIGQFAQIATAKIKASLVSTTNLIAENIVGKKIITQEIVSPVGNIDHLASLNIQTTSLTAQNIETEKLTAQEASVSTLYADNIISHEGSFGEIMSNKISSLRDEMKNIIAARVASESAILAQSHDWTADIATDSARLTGDLALSDNLVVGAKLMVNGDTQLASAFISGTFTAGQVAIKDNIIETTNTALYIQPSKIGSVHIMGDTLVIADNGNIEINANVTVHGSLFANLLKADEIETNKLTSAEVVSNQLKIATDSAQTIIASDTDINLATDSAKLTSNATAGTATLPAGKTELIISTNKLSSSSMVYLTPVGSTNNQVIYVKNKITDSNPYFTIALDQPLDHEVSINWWIIN